MCCQSNQCTCLNKTTFHSYNLQFANDSCPYTPNDYWTSLSYASQSFAACMCRLPLIVAIQGAKSVTSPVSKSLESQLNIIPYTDGKFSHISQASWGETESLYPTPNARNLGTGIYKVENWDVKVTLQLLKARASITLIATRGESVRNSLPNLHNIIEKVLVPYHITDNFPPVDFEIQSKNVKNFFISPNQNAKHPGLNYINNTIKIVKIYGPFFNGGGGDAAIGSQYIICYSVVPNK